MRIIAGKYKGKKLLKPSDRKIRPSSDRMRETIFSILEGGRYGNILQSKRIIDLFAGTGAFGIESISRGNPKKVVFVDNNPSAINIIKSNIQSLNLDDNRAIVLLKNAQTWENWNHGKFELIFSDPPYYSKLSEIALTSLVNINAIQNGALIIIESAAKEDSPKIEYFKTIEMRKIGNSKFHFLIFEY